MIHYLMPRLNVSIVLFYLYYICQYVHVYPVLIMLFDYDKMIKGWSRNGCEHEYKYYNNHNIDNLSDQSNVHKTVYKESTLYHRNSIIYVHCMFSILSDTCVKRRIA